MRNLTYIIFLFLLSFGQLTAQEPTGTKLDFQGAINNNRGTQAEYFEQRRTVLYGLTLTDRSKVQVGISKTRIGNDEYLEFPFLFRYQAAENLSVYGGVQATFSRNATQGDTPRFKVLQPTIGLDYDITPAWDAGIQFMIPTSLESTIPDIGVQPLRLRTGIKF